MKIQILSLAFLLLGLGLKAQEAQPQLVALSTSSVDNDMRWDETTHDFGTIEKGNPQTAEFVVTNSGETPLILTDVKSTCGCTVASHADGPVMPGESTTVSATYNAKRPGPFRKSVKVMTNRSDSPILLTLTGTVGN